MSTADRLQRIYESLDPVDRARIVRRYLDGGRDPDPLLLSTVPAAKRAEHHRQIQLVMQRPLEMATHIALLEPHVTQLELKVMMLRRARAWAMHRSTEKLFLATLVPEPITRSAYRRLQEERCRVAAAESSGADETDVRDADSSAQAPDRIDLEWTRDLPRLISIKRAWREVEPAALAPPGELDVALEDSVIPVPESASYFQLYKDERAEEVAWLRKQLDLFVELMTDFDEPSPEVLIDTLTAELQWVWREFRCVVLAAERFSRKELRGDDPLTPADRELIGDLRRRLLNARDAVQGDGPAIELPRAEREGDRRPC